MVVVVAGQPSSCARLLPGRLRQVFVVAVVVVTATAALSQLVVDWRRRGRRRRPVVVAAAAGGDDSGPRPRCRPRCWQCRRAHRGNAVAAGLQRRMMQQTTTPDHHHHHRRHCCCASSATSWSSAPVRNTDAEDLIRLLLVVDRGFIGGLWELPKAKIGGAEHIWISIFSGRLNRFTAIIYMLLCAYFSASFISSAICDAIFQYRQTEISGNQKYTTAIGI